MPRPAKRPRLDVDESEVPRIKLEQYEEHRMTDMPDAEVFYVPDFIDKHVAQEWYNELLVLDSWYTPTLKVYGREVTQSRKMATYALDPNSTIKYSGHVVTSHSEYPPLLRKIQDEVEQRLGLTFDHVMLGLYEDGSVYIGNHRDNVKDRVIATISLGAPRTFIMTHDGYKAPKNTALAVSTSRVSKRLRVGTSSKNPEEDNSPALPQKKQWMMDPGSLVVMQGETQKFWKHEIPKEPEVKDGRISLTFRRSGS